VLYLNITKPNHLEKHLPPFEALTPTVTSAVTYKEKGEIDEVSN
jgi:hypothetical protein